MDANVKHCPFCGDAEKLFLITQNIVAEDHRIMCSSCGAIGPASRKPEYAIKAWNIRFEHVHKEEIKFLN